MGGLSKKKSMICTLIQCCWDYRIKEDVLSRTCDKYGREEKRTEKFNWKIGKRRMLGKT
jgi:hypothetical protein